MYRVIPFAIGALFLIFVGCGIYEKTRIAVAPPVYDPMGYYCKARAVWDALSRGDLPGTLNDVMPQRPPGSVLLLYPFGFTPSIPGFLFRSVFTSIAIWILALAITIAASARRKSDAVVGACLVVGLATLPLFYQFEFHDSFLKLYQVTNEWGMVDGLQGSVSALAVCLLVSGIVRNSLSLCIAGWLSAALSLFIKPSGALVMAATIGIAAIELAIKCLRHPEQRRLTLKFAAWLFLSCLSVFGLAFWVALDSAYLDKQTISASIRSQEILRMVSQGQDLLGLFLRFIAPVIGWWWFCAIAFCLMLFGVETIASIVGRELKLVSLRLAGCLGLSIFAVYWWLFMAGTEHRYLFPFILMIIIWLLPDVLERLYEASMTVKSAVACYCLVPVFLLPLLLWSPRPLMSLQSAMGINLSTGQVRI